MWNLPARSKMVEPSFAVFWAREIPKWTSEDGLAKATVCAEDYLPRVNVTTTEEKERPNIPNNPRQDSRAADPVNDDAVFYI
jgi:redox-sensitive bicupin YhaK (pirin superfamily)